MVSRMKKCGLKSMKEKTKKHCAAFLVHLQEKQGHQVPTAGEFYKLAETVKVAFKASEQRPLVESLNRYPCTPQELGEDTCKFSVLFISFLIS